MKGVVGQEKIEGRLSQAWSRIYEGLPSYDVVKLTEGLNSLWFCMDMFIRERGSERLRKFSTLLNSEISKLKTHKSEQETETMSYEIFMNDIEALYMITKAAYEKLLESDPHFSTSNPSVPYLASVANEYAKTNNRDLLAEFAKYIAEIIIANDLETAKKVKISIGEARRMNEDYMGALYGYETALSHFLLLRRRYPLR